MVEVGVGVDMGVDGGCVSATDVDGVDWGSIDVG